MSVPRQWHSGFNLWKWKHTLQASGGGEQNKPGLKAHGRPRELREASGTAVAPSFTAARRSPAAGLRAAFSLWEGASGWRRTPNPEGSPRCWARAGSDSRRPAAPTPKTTAEAAAAQAETPATAFPIPRGNSPAPRRTAPQESTAAPGRRLPRPQPHPALSAPPRPLPTAHLCHGGRRSGSAGRLRGPSLATSPAPPAFRHTPRPPPGGRGSYGRHLGCGHSRRVDLPRGRVTVVGYRRRPYGRRTAVAERAGSPTGRAARVARQILTSQEALPGCAGSVFALEGIGVPQGLSVSHAWERPTQPEGHI